MKCQNCGNEIETNQPRCPYCGTPIENSEFQKRKWYQSTTFTVSMLILFWPVGLFLMWKYQKQWKKPVKIIISIIFVFVFINFLSSPSSSDSPKKDAKMEKEDEISEVVTSDESEPAPVKEEPELTMGQKNAVSSAKNYLHFMAFSYSGLIHQLEFDGYTTEEATFAADNCDADWYAQAVASAENYLKHMSFSKQGLIDQLLYEGFTQDQAENAVTAVGY